MIRSRTKPTITLIAIITLFSSSFYLSSNRMNESDSPNFENLVVDQKQSQQESSLKQKLEDDFENAFIKQYTPLLGCEDLFSDNLSTKCIQHAEQARILFKDEFIEERGLPKNTFNEFKLSFSE